MAHRLLFTPTPHRRSAHASSSVCGIAAPMPCRTTTACFRSSLPQRSTSVLMLWGRFRKECSGLCLVNCEYLGVTCLRLTNTSVSSEGQVRLLLLITRTAKPLAIPTGGDAAAAAADGGGQSEDGAAERGGEGEGEGMSSV